MEANNLRALIKKMLMENIEQGDFTNVKFDAEEVATFVDDYIRRNKIGERQTSASGWQYELPIDAKQAFDEVGFTRYRVERADNKNHEMYGQQFVIVDFWTKVH